MTAATTAGFRCGATRWTTLPGSSTSRMSLRIFMPARRPTSRRCCAGLFVAPTIRLLDLLHEMRLRRRHLALVVDEFGGVDGLITIEDLVEEIVGEIED